MRSGDADLSNSGEPHSVTTGPAGSSDDVLEGILPNNKVQNTVFVNGPPAPYGTLTASWRDGKQQEASGNYACIYMSDTNAFICHQVLKRHIYVG